MTFSPLTVTHFIESVPICAETDSLERFLTLIKSNPASQWVITNEQKHPLGVIFAHDLLFYALKAENDSQERSLSLNSWKNRTIQELTELIRPLVLISPQTQLKNLLPQLLNPNPPIYAIINPQKQFLGLLNIQGCLQALTAVSEGNFANSCPSSSLFTDFESFPFPIFLKSPLGEVIYQNSAWIEYLGDYIPVDTDFNHPITFNSPQHLQSPLHHTYLAAQLSSYQYKDKTKEWPVFHPDNPLNTQRQWQFYAYPYQFQSWEKGVILIIAIDVTEKQQQYRALEAKNADLLQLNRLKDEFLACISHELKSPLTAVVGLSSLLTDKRVGELNPAQERYAELIYRSGRQLMALVNDLLDLTRLETGQLHLTPSLVNIQEICQQAYQSLENNYADQALPQFSLEINKAEEIWADKQRLKQMLVYLLDNALKFTETEGKIGLKVTSCQHWVTFTIWDTGEGIPEADQSSLFQRFQPPNHHLSSNYPVTGLGLVLTKRLAHLHQGDLSFLSKVGQGSCFTLLLPKKQHHYSSASFSSDGQNLILLVDTLSHFLEDLSDKLQELGYQSVIARTGTEALEKARQLQPKLILLNPWLPLLSGWDVLTLLKSDPQTQEIQVILTDYQTDSSLKSYQADGVLKPPIDLNQLKSFLPIESEEESAGNLEIPDQEFSESPLTVLLLYPESELPHSTTATQSDLALVHQLSKYHYRILQADDLEQAAMLATIWKIDVLVIKGDRLRNPSIYWQELDNFPELAEIPLVTLDAATTQAINHLNHFTVFPYLNDLAQTTVNPLWQVVHQAAASQSNSHLMNS